MRGCVEVAVPAAQAAVHPCTTYCSSPRFLPHNADFPRAVAAAQADACIPHRPGVGCDDGIVDSVLEHRVGITRIRLDEAAQGRRQITFPTRQGAEREVGRVRQLVARRNVAAERREGAELGVEPADARPARSDPSTGNQVGFEIDAVDARFVYVAEPLNRERADVDRDEGLDVRVVVVEDARVDVRGVEAALVADSRRRSAARARRARAAIRGRDAGEEAAALHAARNASRMRGCGARGWYSSRCAMTSC